MIKKKPNRLSKDTKIMMCFRIDKELRRKMKSYVAAKGLVVQDWLSSIIEKNLT